MTKNKWLNLLDTIEGKFGVDKDYKEKHEDDIPGEKHIVEFGSPMGKIKLEWVEKARLLNEKTSYSNRIGSNVKIDKVYSEDEMVNYMNAFKWDEVTNEWEKIDTSFFEN
jgi:hypothetical protein